MPSEPQRPRRADLSGTDPHLGDALAAAVAAVGGTERPGQVEMAEAVARAVDTGEHLLVQAGTGTGKSLAYLVPALLHHEPVVVATATIALQRQLVERDLPRVAAALEPLLGRRPTYALLKGRSNYLCLHRLNEGADSGEPDMDALFDPRPTTKAGRDALRLRRWAETTQTGDRDEVVPAPDERAWRALSVTPHECLGAQRCPYADDCFVEQARETARQCDVVVTNHAMLAIDALSEARLLPEHDVVVVDEGHELVDRATGAVTDELTAGLVDRAAKRARRYAGDRGADLLADAAAILADALESAPEGRIDTLAGSLAGAAPAALFDALVAVRDAGHAALSAMSESGKEGGDDLAARTRARAAVEEVHDVAGRIVAAGPYDVVWLTRPQRRPPALWRAPLSVAGMLREQLFGERTVILTSATLEVGGGFEPVAAGLGLAGEEAPAWRGLDVGSPFDYGKQAILYVAAHLPPPGRDGVGEAALAELTELVEAAGGRTLGLFSSQRGAEAAAAYVREHSDIPVLCQGEDATAELVRQFATDARTCLFGTLSLWQGVDVPGPALQLVVIDRIPFPRPDDPLATARQRAVAAAGGNGFMAVAATQAALRLAQGAGRLIRTADDRGVVAVLDSRLATARYAGFLKRTLPPMWPTTDGVVVRRSLQAIDAAAGPVLPVPERVVQAEGEDADAAASTEAADGDRRGRRWSDEDERALADRFAAGTPVSLLADELGRSPSAVAARLRLRRLAGRVVWGPGEEPPRADRELAYALTLVAAPADPVEAAERIAEVMELDGWQVEQRPGALTLDGEAPPLLLVSRGAVRGLVAVGDAAALRDADEPLRLLAVPAAVEASGSSSDPTCPPGAHAVVRLPPIVSAETSTEVEGA